jgi:2-polyprenyl-3-methyl-5-hydroxy-6-metoxy-1,4-benzoquinol methylase
MFQRPDYTYIIDFEKWDVKNFLNDEANPLGRIVRLIPDGSKVLDIGAGNGILGWLISNLHKNTVIDGVEPSVIGSQTAAKYYRHFYNVFFQEIKTQILQQNYDYIVMADVIEHISDPYSFLKDLVEGLSDKTKIIMSIPNIAHGSVRLSLLNGNFDYVDSGLLERTHLRFFTRKTLESLVEKLNLHMILIFCLQRSFHVDTLKQVFSLSFCSLMHLLRNKEALVYQYIVVITKDDKTPFVEYSFGCQSVSLLQYCNLKLINNARALLKRLLKRNA